MPVFNYIEYTRPSENKKLQFQTALCSQLTNIVVPYSGKQLRK
ncbi:hypothetical protein [Neisseria musculi]|nr:hypothetical protein [Neisseria musculi]